MKTTSAVAKLNTDLKAFSTAKTGETKALAAIDAQVKTIIDGFSDPSKMTPANELTAMQKVATLGAERSHTKDSFDSKIAADKKTAIADLAKATPSLSLKQLNADRQELGLAALKSKPKAPAPVKKPEAAKKPLVYTVQSGDTLSAIASREGSSVSAIAQANHIANVNLIYPGQKLTIPGKFVGGGTSKPPVKHPAPPPSSGGKHATVDRARNYLAQPNGWSCAPTSLAMAEASWGVGQATDSNMFRLANAMHDGPGVGLPGNASLIAAQAQRDGLKASFNSSPDASAVKAALEQGKTAVVNGSLSEGGHFIYVAGLDHNGNFIIFDPARPSVTSMTESQLNAFTHANPGQHPTGFAAIWR